MIDIILEYIDKYQYIFMWIGIISLIMFIASLFIIPFILKKMPDDYFINEKYHHITLESATEILIFILKNILGVLLILAGIIMLFTPGQGIISIIIGLFLMQFKGKYALENKLIQNDLTFNGLNWIREKSQTPPFKRQ